MPLFRAVRASTCVGLLAMAERALTDMEVCYFWSLAYLVYLVMSLSLMLLFCFATIRHLYLQLAEKTRVQLSCLFSDVDVQVCMQLVRCVAQAAPNLEATFRDQCTLSIRSEINVRYLYVQRSVFVIYHRTATVIL